MCFLLKVLNVFSVVGTQCVFFFKLLNVFSFVGTQCVFCCRY